MEPPSAGKANGRARGAADGRRRAADGRARGAAVGRLRAANGRAPGAAVGRLRARDGKELGAADGRPRTADGKVRGAADGRLDVIAGACKIGADIETVGYYVTAQSCPRDVLVQHEIISPVDLLAANGLHHCQLVGCHQAFTPVGFRASPKVGSGDTPV